MDLNHPYIVAALGQRPLPEVPQSEDFVHELLRADWLWATGQSDKAVELVGNLERQDDGRDKERFGAYARGLRALHAGDLSAAYAAYLEAAKMGPDVFASERAVNIAFWTADACGMLAAAEPLRDVVEHQPFAGGVLAFAEHMNDNSAGAEAVARRAIAANHRDPWTLHAVAHCMYHDSARLNECLQWCLETVRPAAKDCTTFMRTHMEFHAALCMISLQKGADLVALLDGELWKMLGEAEKHDYWAASGVLNVLWKAELNGVQVSAEVVKHFSKDALAHLEAADPSKSMVFSLCIQRFKGEAWTQRALKAAEEAQHAEFAGFVRAVSAVYEKGDWAMAGFELQGVKATTERLGASPEQREVIDDFVKVVDARAKRPRLA